MKSDLKLQLRVGAQHQLSPLTNIADDKMRESGLKYGDVVSVTIHGEKRSLSKNALSHVWYAQLDKDRFSDYSAGYARKYCKAHFGIPILCEDEYFRNKYNNLIRKRFTYEEKLELMGWFPVTSLEEMTEDRMSRYLHTMQQVFAEDGVILTTPKDSEYAKWQEELK